MPRRQNKRSRQPRGNSRVGRNNWIPVEGSVRTAVYSGTVAAGGTIALSIASDALTEYRVLWSRGSFSSEKPTLVQLKIRGEETEQQIPSNIAMINTVISKLSVKQPNSEGWWTGDGNQKVAWVSNIGSTEAKYLVACKVRTKINVTKTARIVEEVLPGHAGLNQEDWEQVH